MSILREAKEDKKALLLVLISGFSLGIFLLMKFIHYSNLFPLFFLFPLVCPIVYFFVWVLYASILNRVENSDLNKILKNDVYTYLPSLFLLPLSLLFFVKIEFYPGASPSEEHLKNAIFLFILATTLSSIISLKILVHGHLEWLTESIKSDNVFYILLLFIFIFFSTLVCLKLWS